MEKKQQIILIIVGVLLFLLGLIVGIIFQQQGGVQSVKIETANNLLSKVVSSVTAYGKIENINGKIITLGNLGDSLAISLSENAPIYSFNIDADKPNSAPAQKTVNFEDIKVGDNVNVSVKSLPTGQLQGLSLVILPKPAENK